MTVLGSSKESIRNTFRRGSQGSRKSSISSLSSKKNLSMSENGTTSDAATGFSAAAVPAATHVAGNTPNEKGTATQGAPQQGPLYPATQIAAKEASLEQAAATGDKETLLAELKFYEDPSIQKEARARRGAGGPNVARASGTPLTIAVEHGSLATIEVVLQLVPGFLNTRDVNGDTPLHIAARTGKTEVVELLLKQGDIDWSAHNIKDEAPVDVAANESIKKHLQTLAEQQQKILDQLAQEYVKSPLKDVQETKESSAQQLRANVKELPTTFGDSAEVTAESGRVSNVAAEKVYHFLAMPQSRGVDTSQLIAGQTTLLHESVRRRDLGLMKLILTKGANPLARDRRGKLALDYARDDVIRNPLRSACMSATESPVESNAKGKAPAPMRGSLQKWTNLARGYKQRWFLLQDGRLLYYRSSKEEGSVAPRGSLSLLGSYITQDSSDDTKFVVATPGPTQKLSTFHLKAQDAESALQWVKALKQSSQYFADLERGSIGSGSASATGAAGAGVVAGAGGGAAAAASSGSAPENGGSADCLPFDGERESMYARFHDEIEVLLKLGGSSKAIKASATSLSSLFDDHFAVADAREQFISTHPDVRLDQPALPGGQPRPRLALSSNDVVSTARALAYPDEAESEESDSDVSDSSDDNFEECYYDAPFPTAAAASVSTALGTGAALAVSAGKWIGSSTETKPSAEAPPSQEQPRETPAKEQPAEEEQEKEEQQPSEQPEQELSKQDTSVSSKSEKKSHSIGGALARFKDRKREKSGKSESGGEAPPEEQPAQSALDPIHAPGSEANDTSILSFVNQENPSVVGYKNLRKGLPIDQDKRPSVSLWAILKNSIGKDLSKISFPVYFNEPTSMLQRMAEDIEFANCLERGAETDDSTLRIAFVAAFGMSNYSSTIGRIAKPFNPMLGETFEYVSLNDEYRYISEQVSHHPPISACVAQGARWQFMGEVNAKNKFLGKSFEIRPTGAMHVFMHVPKPWVSHKKPQIVSQTYVRTPPECETEHYTWNKVTTVVTNFIWGSPIIDHYGDMHVKNHLTGDTCVLRFTQRGWRGSGAFEVHGEARDANDEVKWELAGRWDLQLVARRAGVSSEPLACDVTVPENDPNYVLLWKNSYQPPNMPFNLTPFALTLNDLKPELKPWLPPTDCRLRPDQHAFEVGEYDTANELKGKLEDFQRQTRKRREVGELPPHQPRWFNLVSDDETGERLWDPLKDTEGNVDYWTERQRVGEKRLQGEDVSWPHVDEIFAVKD